MQIREPACKKLVDLGSTTQADWTLSTVQPAFAAAAKDCSSLVNWDGEERERIEAKEHGLMGTSRAVAVRILCWLCGER